MKLCVLVTTMHASDDLRLYHSMNLRSDAVIANQCDFDACCVKECNGRKVQVISTKTKGLSRNRNIALAHSPQDADLFLFSDDDLVFNEGYEKLIFDEFEKHPYAEAIKFNIHDLSEKRKISMKRIERFEKCTRRNMSSSGVCGLAIRKCVLKRNNLHFNEFFGSGTDNYCGEDTIFIQEMISKKIRFYRSPADIAGINQKESSWFKGYDDKYFRVAGMVLATCFPTVCRIIAIRSAFKFSRNKKCRMGFSKVLKCYFDGIRHIKRKSGLS